MMASTLTVRARAIINRIVLALSLLALAVVCSSAHPDNKTRAIANVVVAEGGWSADERDPGNRGGTGTLNGIIQRVYDADRAARGLPRRLLSPKMLGSKEWILERDGIYDRLYWVPCAGPILPRGLDYVVLDMCVNAGIARGWTLLMKVLALERERPWSPISDVVAAIKRKGVRETIRAYGEERRLFYRGLAARPPPPPYSVFLTGWLNRETHSRQIALNMFAGVRTGATIVMAPQPYRMGKAIELEEDLLP